MVAARQGHEAAGRGGDKASAAQSGKGGKLRRAWAPVGYLEYAGEVGEGGGWPEWSGDGSMRRRGVVLDGGDLGRMRARVSDGGR